LGKKLYLRVPWSAIRPAKIHFFESRIFREKREKTEKTEKT
jgi:hypothetical protein